MQRLPWRTRPSACGASPAPVAAGFLALAVALGLSACSDERPRGDAGTPAAEAGPAPAGDPPTEAEPDGGLKGGARGADGAIRTEDDELLVLRRIAASLPVDDEARVVGVLELYGASAGRSDPAKAARLAGHLLSLLRDESPVVRRGVIALLGRMAPRDAPDTAILPSLGDDVARVRAEAVKVLALRGPLERVDRFVSQSSDPDPLVRRAVARALGQVQTAESRRILLGYLLDPDGEVVRAAGDSLAATLQDAPPAEVLAAATDERPITRIAAARVLAALGARESLVLLRQMSTDPVWEVRREAIRGLGALQEPHAAVAKQVLEDVVRAPERSRTDRFEALQEMARIALTPDLELLNRVARTDADQVIRMVAARTILARGDMHGLAVLVDLLGLEIGPTMDEEDCLFILRTSAETLEAIAGSQAGDGSQAAWRAALPEIANRLAAGYEYTPVRLVEFW